MVWQSLTASSSGPWKIQAVRSMVPRLLLKLQFLLEVIKNWTTGEPVKNWEEEIGDTQPIV